MSSPFVSLAGCEPSFLRNVCGGTVVVPADDFLGERDLRLRRQCSEAHVAHEDRNLQLQRLARSRADHHIGADGIVVDDRCQTSDPDIYAIGCFGRPGFVLGRRADEIGAECGRGKKAHHPQGQLDDWGGRSRLLSRTACTARLIPPAMRMPSTESM